MNPKKVIVITVVDKPGVKSKPKNFCKKYQPPNTKLNIEKKIPSNDTNCSGLEVKPNNPFKPILREPINLLYFVLPAYLSSRMYLILDCLNPTKKLILSKTHDFHLNLIFL